MSLLKLLLPPLLLLLQLAVPGECAASEEAQLEIERAIRAAILDGLAVVDGSMRRTYWYFLHGAQLASYNASVSTDHLNYILLYTAGNNLYRANSDLTFAAWTPALNSFVQVVASQAALAAIRNNITVLAQSSNYLDLTDSALAVSVHAPPPLPLQSPSTANITTTSTAPTPTNIPNQPAIAAEPDFPSAAGVIVLQPIPNLSTNS